MKQKTLFYAIALLFALVLPQMALAQSSNKNILVVHVSGSDSGTQYSLADAPHIVFSQSASSDGHNDQFVVNVKGSDSGIISLADMVSGEGFYTFTTDNGVAVTMMEDPDNLGTYYSTFSHSSACTLPEGITAYVATAEDSEKITFTEVEGALAAETGYLLIGTLTEGNGTEVVSLSETTAAATTPDTNYLVPTLEATTVDASADYYVLSYVANSIGVGFYKVAEETTIPAGRAYIDGSTIPASSALKISFVDNEATGISLLENSTEEGSHAIYTIQGIRVADMNRQGIYIVDGKKVLVK